MRFNNLLTLKRLYRLKSNAKSQILQSNFVKAWLLAALTLCRDEKKNPDG